MKILYRPGGLVLAIDRPAVVELAPRAYRAKLTGLHFETDKAFLLPRAMKGIRVLKRFYDRHPGLAVLVVGHADKVGDDEYNRVLSEERAVTTAAYLTDDVPAWEAWFGVDRPAGKRWGTREVQHMLTALSDEAGALYAGPVHGVDDPPTQAAVRRFQAWSNRTRGTALAVDGVAGPQTRRALCASYLALDGTTLPAGTTLASHGCGEFHPIVAVDGPSEENRRVEIFLFEGPIEPPPVRCQAPGCSEYARWNAAVVEEIDLENPPSDANGTVTFRVVDPRGVHQADTAVIIDGPDGRCTHVTDGDGEVRLPAAPGQRFKLIGLVPRPDRIRGLRDVVVTPSTAG